MVRAILEGRKTQTRRAIPYFDGKTYATNPERVRWQFNDDNAFAAVNRSWRGKWWAYEKNSGASELPLYGLRCKYGVAGDRLWVRETTAQRPFTEGSKAMCGKYVVDDKPVVERLGFDLAWWYSKPVCPAIHMPRHASRILIDVVGVRVERLQEISERDAIAEGVHHQPHLLTADGGRILYRQLWDLLNAKRAPYTSNPWVFVVEFERVR